MQAPESVDTTVVVPTFNESGNVGALVDRLQLAFAGRTDVEILFVDDSTDDTPERVREVARDSTLSVRLIRREGAERIGGLAGAVTAGLAAARGSFVVVMDGDLQHPPELAPLLRSAVEDVDLVVASRYCGAGDSSGLSSSWRRSVSSGSTLLARACFPRRVARVCTDPMTGFFCVRRSAVDLDRLRPRGFKILLEILARHQLRVAEIPFVFGERVSGESKASWRNGVQFLYQMAALRMGRMSRFAAVGALGTLLNLAVMWSLIHLAGVHYVPAAVIATEVAIVHNFLMQERFVFRDLRAGRHRMPVRFAQNLLYNNVDTLVRIPVLVLLVERLSMPATLAQALTLLFAFVARYCFVALVVYGPARPRRQAAAPPTVGTVPVPTVGEEPRGA